MNPDTVHADDTVLQLKNMQEQIKILQQQTLSANQMMSGTVSTYRDLASSLAVMDVAKSDKVFRK